MLYAAIGEDAPAAAELLLAQLSTLREVVNADIHQLTKILGGNHNAAKLVVAAKGLMEASLSETIKRTPLRSDDRELLRYLVMRLRWLREETMFALFADQQGNFISEEQLSKGNSSSVAFKPRTLFGRALALDARYILLVHNHPSGEAKASPADISVTRALTRQAHHLDISIIDHLIVGGSQIYSMKRGNDL